MKTIAALLNHISDVKFKTKDSVKYASIKCVNEILRFIGVFKSTWAMTRF